jgi:putative ABC transport system permease protein
LVVNPLASFEVAIAALKVNALRSFLAMLGVIIGVASVIVMVSVASGAGEAIEARIKSLGTNVLVIFPGSFTSGGRRAGEGTALALSEGDLAAIRAAVPTIVAAAGMVTGSAPIVFGNSNWTTQVNGVNADYLDVRDWPLADGRSFTDAELRSGAKVVILGATTQRELFGNTPAIGEQVRIKNVPFTVIGTLAVKGQTGFGTDQDDTALVPVSTARRRLFGAEQTVPDNLRSIMVEVASADEMSDAQEEIENLLRQRRHVRPGMPDDFQVRNMAEFIRARSETQSILSVLLGATAAISLVVGGIGIMNIMLVSVTERTKEIGLRMAVGARRRDILSQFLIEAVTLCVTGGVIGLLIGSSAAIAMSVWGNWPIALKPSLVLIALVSAGLVGVFFGYYPARRASLMNPIDALRYE